MNQVVVLHGGDAFESYDEYIQNLCQKVVTLDRLRSVDWKANLQKDLGSNFDVLTPKMPNAYNARYLEWKIWFDKIIPLLDDEVIFVGHSLGGIFLVKYLSENKFSKKIIETLLVSAPYSTPAKNPLVDFNITSSLKGFASQAGKIIIYHSREDLVVPFNNAELYNKELSGSKLRIFEGRGHFNDEHFPELVADVKDSFHS